MGMVMYTQLHVVYEILQVVPPNHTYEGLVKLLPTKQVIPEPLAKKKRSAYRFWHMRTVFGTLYHISVYRFWYGVPYLVRCAKKSTASVLVV